MKKIELTSLKLQNFKGIKDFEFIPKGSCSVFGTNKSGKSTLMNAYIWLFWGKDKFDRKDFEIKTLDKNNVPISKIEHSVTGLFNIGDEDESVKIQRVYKEKWQKKRGEDNPELTGHETLFFINEVPYQAGEFSDKINTLIGDEFLFKMLSNPIFFNDEKMLPWKKRREVLISIIDEVSDQSIIDSDQKFKELFEKLTNKPVDEYKREIASKKKVLKQKLDEFPVRIDELTKNMPEKQDYQAIEKQILLLEKELSGVKSKIQDKTKLTEEFFEKKNKQIKQKGIIQNRMSEIKMDELQKINEKTNEFNIKTRQYEDQIRLIKKSIEDDTQKIILNNANLKLIDLQHLRDEINKLEAVEFVLDENETICPICKRKLDEDDLSNKRDELSKNFYNERQKKINSINEIGISLKERLDKLNSENEVLEKSIKMAEDSLKEEFNQSINHKNSFVVQNIDVVLFKNEEYLKLSRQLSDLENNQKQPVVNIDDLKLEEERISSEIIAKNKLLFTKTQIEKDENRKEELLAEEKETAQFISNLEKDEFLIESFEKIKMDSIENKINALFSPVKFKLFRSLINGGYEPWCECLINGVPFQAANSAAQVNSGIEIINVLNDHFGVSLPIWIDNREGVVELCKTNNQVINLYVSEKDLTLRIDNY